MADYKEILYEKQRKGVLITLNRPQTMNALNQSLLKEFHQALDEAEADPEVRAIVLTGAGRAFSSGMEQGGPRTGRRAARSWPAGLPSGMSVAEYMDAWRGDSRNLLRLWELGKPVIGAINGWAMGAGSWLAIATHITIASENAVFSQPEVRHGSNTSFFWTFLAGFAGGLAYWLCEQRRSCGRALGGVFPFGGKNCSRCAGDGQDQFTHHDPGIGDDGAPRRSYA